MPNLKSVDGGGCAVARATVMTHKPLPVNILARWILLLLDKNVFNGACGLAECWLGRGGELSEDLTLTRSRSGGVRSRSGYIIFRQMDSAAERAGIQERQKLLLPLRRAS